MKSLSVAAALLLAPALAAAQPGPTDEQAPPPPAVAVQPPQGAPQNVPWSELSHVNGQLVPVGDQNQYFTHALRKTNISVNPIGALFGWYGGGISYAVSDHVAIKGDLEIFDGEDLKGSELNLTAPLYLRKTYTGLFIEPGVMVRTLQDTSYDDCYDCYESTPMTVEKTAIGPEVMIGYHYMTDSGFNVAAAFGAMRNLNHQKTDAYDDEIDIQPAGYFRVGYAF